MVRTRLTTSVRFAAAASIVALGCLAGATAHAQTLPSPWASRDIGNPPAAGSATASGGQFTIQASGADIWGTSDQFHYVYQQVAGDVDVMARVDAITQANAWSKAGVMIRSSLAANAAHAFALASAARGLAFQRRRSDGGWSYHTTGAYVAPPRWVRLIRKGTSVTAYSSNDGATWTLIGSDTVALGTSVYVGIAVTSHASGLTTAKVSSVSVAPLSLPSPWQTSDIGAVGADGSATDRQGAFQVAGAGADIWDTADAFRFVYQPMSGDVDIRAHVASLEYISSWTKAGVMIRESLAAGSRQGIALVSAGKGYAFQRRVNTNGLSTHTYGGSGKAPGWLRVARVGDRIEAYRSADGVTWTLIDTDTIAMGSTVYVGLAVSSHVDGTLADGVFDSVSVTSQGSGTNQPPSVSLTAPSSGATYTAPATLTVSATASDADGQVARVDFLANNSVIGTDSTAPYSISWSGVAAGTYSVTAVAYDDGGASKSSSAVTITVSGSTTNKPPTVSITSPSNGANFAAPTTLNISANASDPEGSLTRVDFYGNGTLIGTDTTSPYAASVANVPAGTYALTARAYDGAGNSTTSATVTVTVGGTSTNEPPTVSLTAPSNGASYSAPATITISASASDPEGAMSRVDFYANGTQIGSDASAPYSFSWSNVAAGTYSITAVARDAAGNTTTSSAVSVNVSGTTSSGSWVVAFTASADHATVTRYVLEIFASGANPSTATPVATSDLGKPTPNATNDISVDRTTFFNGLAAGSYIATVRAENSAGMSRSTPVSFMR